MPVDSAYTLGVEHFVKITLSCTISEINAFLCFTQKFKMAAKNGGKTIFGKVASRLYIYPGGVKNFFQKLISRHLYNKPTCQISCK